MTDIAGIPAVDATTEALRRAALRATQAPSIHNTQPWRFVLRRGELRVLADGERQLRVLDPRRRGMTLSLGAALFNARVSLAADGVATSVHRLPDTARPELVAVIRAGGESPDPALAGLEKVVDARTTNRRHFADEAVADDVLEELCEAARVEGAELYPITTEAQRLAVAALSQHADAIENLDPAYRAELRAWTSDDSSRRDGVPSLAVPHVDGTAHDEVPIRDFDTRGAGFLPADTRSGRQQTLLLLATPSDERPDWLRAGEAFERILLEVTRRGLAASPLTQVTEMPSTRSQLRREMGMTGWPHVLLRVGSGTARPRLAPPPTGRRPDRRDLTGRRDPVTPTGTSTAVSRPVEAAAGRAARPAHRLRRRGQTGPGAVTGAAAGQRPRQREPLPGEGAGLHRRGGLRAGRGAVTARWGSTPRGVGWRSSCTSGMDDETVAAIGHLPRGEGLLGALDRRGPADPARAPPGRPAVGDPAVRSPARWSRSWGSRSGSAGRSAARSISAESRQGEFTDEDEELMLALPGAPATPSRTRGSTTSCSARSAGWRRRSRSASGCSAPTATTRCTSSPSARPNWPRPTCSCCRWRSIRRR